MTNDQEPAAPGDSGQTVGVSVPPPGSPPANTGGTRSRRQALLDNGRTLAGRAKTGTVGAMWSRLNAVDFMNSAMQFAALAIICFVPVLIVLDAAVGRDPRQTIISRLGLNAQAAKDVDALIGGGRSAVAALTVTGVAWLVFSALAIASTLQGWYQRVYDQPLPHDWKKPLVNRVVWLVGLGVYIWLEALIGRQVGPSGGHVLIFVCEFVVAVLFWWWAVHVLLLGQIGWRALFPTGLATGICLTGLAVFSSLLFSQTIISDANAYGPIGTMIGLLSYAIGFGVCLHLGAVVGRMWNERHTPVKELT